MTDASGNPVAGHAAQGGSMTAVQTHVAGAAPAVAQPAAAPAPYTPPPGFAMPPPPPVMPLPLVRRMTSNMPAQKVMGASLASAIVSVLVWFYNQSPAPDLPFEISAALMVIVTAIVGCVVPPGRKDQVEEMVSLADLQRAQANRN
ncbi:MAG: hypothetical protein AAGC57_18345 [Pseudomonadota bacterium]